MSPPTTINTAGPVHVKSWPSGSDAFFLGIMLGAGAMIGAGGTVSILASIARLASWAVA